MATKIYAKSNDTYTPLKVNGNLTSATQIRVLHRPQGDDAPGTPLTYVVTNALKGELDVQTEALADGVYEVEVEVMQGTTRFTFPTRGFVLLIIGEDLG